jgi:hypothetical protein
MRSSIASSLRDAAAIEKLYFQRFPAVTERWLRNDYLTRRTRSATYYAALDAVELGDIPLWMRLALKHTQYWHKYDPHLVEDDYVTLPARHAKLVADMEAKCRELVKARDYVSLKTLAAKLKELKALDVTPYL